MPLPAVVAEEMPLPGALSQPPARTSRGTTLRIALDSEPASLHPWLEGDGTVSRLLLGSVYETLVECRQDRYAPGLAQSWEFSADGTRLVLRLRPDVRWHDDRPFGVVDVQATFEALLRGAAATPLLHANLQDVLGVEIAVGGTVKLKLRRRSDFLLRVLCDLPILPDTYVRGKGLDSSPLARRAVGTGPYRFLAWEKGKRVRLGRADERALLDEIVLEIEHDAVRALGRIRRGEVDVLLRVAEAHYPEQVEPASLQGALSLVLLHPDRTSFLAVNHRHPLLSDVRFRQALAALWDRDRLAAELHRGLVRPTATLAPGLAPPPVYDRALAVAALEAAGYRDHDSDGVRDRGGKPLHLTLLVPAGSKIAAAEARAYALELRRAGLLLDLTTLDPPALLGRLRTGAFDLAPVSWEGRPDDDPGPAFGSNGSLNFGRYRGPVLDGLIDELRLAPDPVARRAIGVRLAAHLASEQPGLFLYRHDVPAVVSRRVHGLAATGDRIDLRGAWVDAP